tara:strand:+ start:360 stop:584 length:225 start_codon:yes stop_codon:yes gene_type:complete
MMQFDTVHEYNFGDGNVHLHYCDEHQTLIVVNHIGSQTNRLMLDIPKDAINAFRLDLNKDELERSSCCGDSDDD